MPSSGAVRVPVAANYDSQESKHAVRELAL